MAWWRLWQRLVSSIPSTPSRWERTRRRGTRRLASRRRRCCWGSRFSASGVPWGGVSWLEEGWRRPKAKASPLKSLRDLEVRSQKSEWTNSTSHEAAALGGGAAGDGGGRPAPLAPAGHPARARRRRIRVRRAVDARRHSALSTGLQHEAAGNVCGVCRADGGLRAKRRGSSSGIAAGELGGHRAGLFAGQAAFRNGLGPGGVRGLCTALDRLGGAGHGSARDALRGAAGAGGRAAAGASSRFVAAGDARVERPTVRPGLCDEAAGRLVRSLRRVVCHGPVLARRARPGREAGNIPERRGGAIRGHLPVVVEGRSLPEILVLDLHVCPPICHRELSERGHFGLHGELCPRPETECSAVAFGSGGAGADLAETGKPGRRGLRDGVPALLVSSAVPGAVFPRALFRARAAGSGAAGGSIGASPSDVLGVRRGAGLVAGIAARLPIPAQPAGGMPRTLRAQSVSGGHSGGRLHPGALGERCTDRGGGVGAGNLLLRTSPFGNVLHLHVRTDGSAA